MIKEMKWSCYATKYNEESESWFAYCEKYGIPYQKMIPIPPPLKWKIKKWFHDKLRLFVMGCVLLLKTDEERSAYVRSATKIQDN